MEWLASDTDGPHFTMAEAVEEPKWKLCLRLLRPDVLTELAELRIETLSQIRAALENLPVLAAAFRRSESEMESTFQMLRILVANYGSSESWKRALNFGYMPPMTEEAFSEKILRPCRASGMVPGGPLGLLAGNSRLLRAITPRPNPRLLSMSRGGWLSSDYEEAEPSQVILQAYDVFEVDGQLYVYSWCPMGSLRQLVDANHRIPIQGV